MLVVNRELRIANDVDEQDMGISSWISFLLSVDISVLPGTTQMNDLTQLPTVESKAGNDSNHMTDISQFTKAPSKNYWLLC